jgi:DNA (cytosine-5)-methyltransferase 1
MNIPVIDLFAGAGGIGIGVNQAGGDLKLSVEIDKVCCATLKANKKLHPGKVLESDVSVLKGEQLREIAGVHKNDPLVIVGGPPCQPFSKASYWTDPGNDSRYRRARANGQKLPKPKKITEARPDERRSLVQEFLDRIVEAKADGFLFENVRSILHPRNKLIVDRFIQCAENKGYKTSLVIANAAEYGIPQLRERVFILGSKHAKPMPPPKTHSKTNKKIPRKKPVVTAGSILSKINKDKYFEPEEIVTGKWEREFKEIPPGMNYKALTKWAGHPKPVFVAETKFWSFLLKLSPDKPSWTIAASPGPWTGPFHWDNRRLRTVEMAALQSFPIGYNFTGSRRERVKQIGNAAPPLLVKQMVECVFDAISVSYH